MTELAHTTHVKEIERIVEHLNEDWINGDLENMEQYFHNHVVMIEPGTDRRKTGIEQMIESYGDFIQEAEVSDFKITGMHVDIFDTTAIAYYTYHIKYMIGSTKYDESNAEILVLRQHEEEWQILWRTQLMGQ